MKIIKLFSFAVLLALVASSCSKDDGARKFRLFANPIRNASKIQMNPGDLTSSWVAGEKINLNGQECVITESNSNSTSNFSITCQNVPTKPIYAIYPSTMDGTEAVDDGNIIITTYNQNSSTVKLKQLTIDFSGNSHKVIFPMAAKITTEENTDKLLFDHLTAGFKITIENTATEACTLSAIRVFAQCPNPESTVPETWNGVSVSWERQGLIVPSGPIGGINGDVALQNACEMFFKMKSGNNDYVVIPAANQQNGKISFCIPATVRAISSITVTGVGTDGADVFARTMSSSNANVARNNMYAIPTITIPVQTQPQSK